MHETQWERAEDWPEELEQARQHAADDTVKTGEEVLADMRLKYGL